MTSAERRRLLGDDVIAEIHQRVAQAPPPTPEVIDALRPILTRPALHIALADAPTTVPRAA
ncbi:hypothetical protein OIE71_04495 [Streptomyces sp. NBC_01725]|uniref:hypothetical protein n=1 Tax=Streptomyces sp. NBC_01725 TaxID=2975923 RepID=UPI002E2DB994|nr:hypothetical protein [Streptomyces sp. NBC_01725]